MSLPQRGRWRGLSGKIYFSHVGIFAASCGRKFLPLSLTLQGSCKREESQEFSCYPERSRGSRWIFKSIAKVQQFFRKSKCFAKYFLIISQIFFCVQLFSIQLFSYSVSKNYSKISIIILYYIYIYII